MKKKDYCTFFFEGNWSDCCWTHDEKVLLAREYKSRIMRLEADEDLKECVKQKGHPIIANIMFIGVRFWAIIKGGY